MSEIDCQRRPAPPALLREWNHVLEAMPETVRGAITPELWNLDWLHALDLPVQDMPISDFAWLFDLPLWAVNGVPFQITPNDVRNDPQRYAAQHRRTITSDLSWPVHIMRFRGRWIVLDGVHRLLKADMLGERTIRAMALSADDYGRIVYPLAE